MPPSRWTAGEQIEGYLSERNVDIIDYNTYEEISRLGIRLPEDYKDSAHLNYKGALIVSK